MYGRGNVCGLRRRCRLFVKYLHAKHVMGLANTWHAHHGRCMYKHRYSLSVHGFNTWIPDRLKELFTLSLVSACPRRPRTWPKERVCLQMSTIASRYVETIMRLIGERVWRVSLCHLSPIRCITVASGHQNPLRQLPLFKEHGPIQC